MEILTIPSTGPSTGTNVGTLTSANPARMTFTLLSEADPAAPPADIATIHLSESVSTTAGVFLSPGAPRIFIAGDPASLWVSVHSPDDFVQIVVE